LGRPIGLGTYTHLSASLHVYERHFKMVEKILDEDRKQDYRNVLEMPPMQLEVPLKQLMRAESEIRRAPSIVSLIGTLNQISSEPNLRKDYWLDWCQVLASHRATKLNDVEMASKFLSSTSFEGYRYFSKP